MTTIKDVAALAGVGVGTASRAISGRGAVSALALKRVQEAVAALGFRPSRVARALSSKSSGMIGVYVPTFEGTFFAPILQAIDRELRAVDQHMVTATNFGQGPRRTRSLNGIQFLIERQCDGILVIESYLLDEDIFELRKQVPRFVLMNRDIKGLEEDSFSVNHEAAGRLAARALLALGHRKIAIMHSLRHSVDVTARVQGFKHELGVQGMAITSEFAIEGLLNYASGWKQADAIAAMSSRPFTALFCTTDVIAMATLSRLQEAGIRVPEELSILGYDGAELAAYTSPTLSTVRVPSQEVAANASRHLINQCYGLKLSAHRNFNCEVILRNSSAPGPHGSTPSSMQ